MPLKRMLEEGRNFGPKAVALLLARLNQPSNFGSALQLDSFKLTTAKAAKPTFWPTGGMDNRTRRPIGFRSRSK
jgi:hypothetical protein